MRELSSTCLPLLVVPQPHRAGLLEGEGAALRMAEARTRAQVLVEAMGRALGAGLRVHPRRPQALRTLRLPRGGPTAMTNALVVSHQICRSQR
jgi:hypothetical protein